MIFNYETTGGDSEMLNTIKKCSSCGIYCDSSFIYWNPINQKETCFFELVKRKRGEENDK
ncbi:hypothetical protein M0R19_01935 [Candidatus Pacearchaeota archaeon]|nr:hypothetical protein [Candidatus Pacearchaeota archaeon]